MNWLEILDLVVASMCTLCVVVFLMMVACEQLYERTKWNIFDDAYDFLSYNMSYIMESLMGITVVGLAIVSVIKVINFVCS